MQLLEALRKNEGSGQIHLHYILNWVSDVHLFSSVSSVNKQLFPEAGK